MRPEGSALRAAFSAACTSRAAPLMSRSSSNCSTMRVEPRALADVISVMPAMRPSERSSGIATVAAIVSGLAPGSDADTEMVGRSTRGSGDTGSRRKATAPASVMPIVSSVVATGRSMKGAEIFMPPSSFGAAIRAARAASRRALIRRSSRSNAR